MDCKVSIIIPSAGQKHRRESLFRAIDSILTQRGVKAVPIVVLNGENIDPEIAETLKSRPDIILEHQAEASLPRAICAKIKRRWLHSLHMISEHYRGQGEYQKAWRFHLRSLLAPQGMKFLPYSYHLAGR